ncbi:MAG TPA: hypothetical protein VG895_04175 [Patescibacteria group bacterium]|nr:hypothetical protein [Patescibacteria group bacterium]
MSETEINNREQSFIYFKEGPKLKQVLDHPVPRTNMITSIPEGVPFNRGYENKITEAEGINQISNYINEVKTISQKNSNKNSQETLQLATSFGENLVFLGEHELQEASYGLARHIIETAQQGKTVYLYPYQDRSPQYITLRILEEIDSQTEQFPEIRGRIKLETDTSAIARRCAIDPDHSKVLIPDDFILSGTKLKGAMGQVNSELLKKELDPKKIIEGVVIASPIRDNENLKSLTEYGNIISYYGIPEVKNPSGGWMFDSGVAMTGSWCSVDYGFQTTIKRLHDYLSKQNDNLPTPKLYNIQRPYEKDEKRTTEYKDLDLQRMWEKVKRKYALYPGIHP